ncbi:hypothetical protein [Kutzneria kofuensis]|uniref:Uncharacterized protein n=1 Tax=Kutzneria kofuensis TaxID=103725 RepID=A0A7W9NN15_9PSEU|nr:hypothetical protein [Kutzneria kofuensis]MBB5898116.1 hypothetical protein [Kutzneria kofuensis]
MTGAATDVQRRLATVEQVMVGISTVLFRLAEYCSARDVDQSGLTVHIGYSCRDWTRHRSTWSCRP